MEVRLVNHTPYPEYQIARAALFTRRKSPQALKNLERFLEGLKQRGEWSPFEFADATFEIHGISRVCSHQLVRHRLCSFAQVSFRHVSVNDFVLPESVPEELRGTVRQFFESSRELYTLLRDKGVPLEDARFVIPSAATTSLLVKANFRQWYYVINLRLSSPSQWEIKEVCLHVLRQLNEIAPIVFGDLWEKFGE